jgi:GTPase
MFIDEAIIILTAGNGGNGCFAYLREKYRPKGGPSGGSGGRGGSIFLQGSHHLQTLQELKFHRQYKAESGAHGKGGHKDGKDAKDIIVLLPLGTAVYDGASGELLFDAVDEKETFRAARGGAGGKGNAALRTRQNPLPDHAQEGEEGEKKQLRLVLKVLADVGLVGMPNAGKSTFLSKISSAKPKIADYPFTTTHPFLGVVRCEGYRSFVVADIPGLIEGSARGKGLGIQFLRHIERTRVLAVLVPASCDDPVAQADILLHELGSYNPLLLEKPACFVLSKSDLLTKENRRPLPEGWLVMSSLTGEGVDAVRARLKQLLDESFPPPAEP